MGFAIDVGREYPAATTDPDDMQSMPCPIKAQLTKLILLGRRPPFSLCHWLCMLTLRSVEGGICENVTLHAVYSGMPEMIPCRHL